VSNRVTSKDSCHLFSGMPCNQLKSSVEDGSTELDSSDDADPKNWHSLKNKQRSSICIDSSTNKANDLKSRQKLNSAELKKIAFE